MSVDTLPRNIRDVRDQERVPVTIGKTYFAHAEDIPLTATHVENYVRATQDKKISLTQLFEQLNPTDPTNREHDGSDAYMRMLKRFGIRTKSDIITGIQASDLGDFFYPPERRNGVPDEKTRAAAGTFLSNDPQSWILFPEFVNRQLRVTPIAQDILGEIIAKVTPVDAVAMKTIYMEDTRDQRRMNRVPEGSELPLKYFQLKEHDVAIYKYGLRLKNTYEFARRIRLDIFSLFLQRIAAQNKLDQAETAVDIIINGDGNANATPTWTASTLDPNSPAGPGTVYDTYLALYGYPNQSSTITKGMTYSAFLKYKATLFPMAMSTILGRLNELLQIITLQFPNINPLLLLAQFNAEGVKIGSIELAQDVWQSVRLVYMPFMVGGQLIGIDKNLLLEELVEVNSNITENARDIVEQTNTITISQNVGFNKIINEAGSGFLFI